MVQSATCSVADFSDNISTGWDEDTSMPLAVGSTDDDWLHNGSYPINWCTTGGGGTSFQSHLILQPSNNPQVVNPLAASWQGPITDTMWTTAWPFGSTPNGLHYYHHNDHDASTDDDYNPPTGHHNHDDHDHDHYD